MYPKVYYGALRVNGHVRKQHDETVQQQFEVTWLKRTNVLIEMLLLVRRAEHHDALIGEKAATINVQCCTRTRTE